ncbi:DUF2931 family protein [Chryseobacterium sp.]|uniref:DUF2931 family protein n=1 Tax=Chryseobacterium sp. TaxID=1871047 RepID=UPI0038911063
MNQQDSFPYMVTATAPTEYPTEVHIGYFADKNKKLICGVPKTGVSRDGWQYDGTEGGQGGADVPYYFALTYVAYAEKKFYTVETELPHDKILALFRKGYDRYDESGRTVHETYTTITVGMAPGGMVVLWLSGLHNRVEICRLQAKETFVDVNSFYDNPHERTQQGFFDELYKIAVPDSIKSEISKSGLPIKKYENYRDHFQYRFVLNPYDDKDYITYENTLYFNGEEEEILGDAIIKNDYKKRGIPYKSILLFTLYNTTIIFDDDEILKVFNTLQSKHINKPIDIILTPTFMFKDIKLSVRCENDEIPLFKSKIQGVFGG